jgi:uncharacterized protein YlzI (FlbEa/FlbD family)
MIELTKADGTVVYVNSNAIGYIRANMHNSAQTDVFNLASAYVFTVSETVTDVVGRVRATRCAQ